MLIFILKIVKLYSLKCNLCAFRLIVFAIRIHSYVFNSLNELYYGFKLLLLLLLLPVTYIVLVNDELWRAVLQIIPQNIL